MNPSTLIFRLAGLVAVLLTVAGCAQPQQLQRPEPAAPAIEGPAAAASAARRQAASRRPVAKTTAAVPSAPAASGAEADPPARLIRGNDTVVGAGAAAVKFDGPPVDLRFEDTPVREAVHAILGDLLKLDYVMYPPVDGRVTIATASQVPPDTAVFLLEAALQANGLAMARDARGVVHVGRPESLRSIVPAVRVAGKDPLPPGVGAIVIPLRYIGAVEMATILRPLAPGDAIVRVDALRNLLVMVGNRAQAEGWLSMVATFDVNLLAGMSVGVFPLKYVTVREVEAALQVASSGGARSAASPPPAAGAAAGSTAAAAAAPAEGHPLFGAIRILPIERLNSVVIITPRAAYLDEARRWIERLDQPSDSASEARLHVYPVRNGSARHLGEVLNGIFGGTTTTQPGATTAVAPGLSRVSGATAPMSIGGASRTTTARAATAAGSTSPGVSALQLGGNVRVVADERNNAILVYSSSAQFEHIEEALRKLDLPPTQVLIEASILEVSLTGDLNYGVQWLFSEDRGNGSTGTSVLSNVAGGRLGSALSGFSYTLRNSNQSVRAVLNALADKSLVRVISSPSLMVLDNHMAQIVVGNQQPVLSGETLSAEGTVRTTTIQYKDTGVSLSVTPSVGAGDMVTMTIDQAVTDVGSIDAATGQRAFLQRQIASKVAVRSGESVVLGGLIRENNTDGSSGVPGLSEIPLLGALFGTKSRASSKTELLVVITPRVARSDDDMRDISRALRDRMRGLGDLRHDTPESAVHPLPAEPR